MQKIFNRQFYLIIGFLILAELVSFFGYFLSDFRQVSFFIVLALFLVLTLKDLKYGLYFIFAELIIGSKGYLFYFEHEGLILSIRIAFWLIVMSVWLAGFLRDFLRKRELSQLVATRWLQNNESHPVATKKYLAVLFIFIFWGFANGYLNKNEFSNLFFDFNGWLYFGLIFPFYSVFAKSSLEDLFQIFFAAISWLVLKTFVFLFLFSHYAPIFLYEGYRWVRESGVGEITKMQGGFYRIFFQSHIFILIALIFGLVFAKKYFEEQNKKLLVFVSFLIVALGATILISFSRSYWAGLLVGIFFYEIIIFRSLVFQKWVKLNGIFLFLAFFSVVLVAGIVKFPYSEPKVDFNASLFSDRASKITGEAGVSSRWSLLPELWAEIKEAPILGKGFGATVTYTSEDPRVLESSPTGKYTTYAFEWGWLDIWLKLGLFGTLVYFAFLTKLFFSSLDKSENKYLKLSFGLGIVVLASVSFFSPYLNHPLGIGYLIVASLFLDSSGN